MIKADKLNDSANQGSKPFASGSELRLLTVRDVADRLQVSERTIRRRIASEELVVVRIGSAIRVSEAALKAFLTRQGTK